MCDLQMGSVCEEEKNPTLWLHSAFKASTHRQSTTLVSSAPSGQLLALARYPCSALVLIPYLKTNPALIQNKCKAKPADKNVISIPVFLLSANLTLNPVLWDCTHSGPPGPQLSCRGWTETHAPRCRCTRRRCPVGRPGTGGCSVL